MIHKYLGILASVTFVLLITACGGNTHECLVNHSNCTSECSQTIKNAGLKYASETEECEKSLRIAIADCEGKENPDARRACINFALNSFTDCHDDISKEFRSKLYKGQKCRENCREIAAGCSGREIPKKDIINN